MTHSFKLPHLLIIVVGLFLLGIGLFQDFPDLLNWYYDDSFFYFKIAQNVAHHGVFSFDGINLTNGFHPLWLLTLVPPMYLLEGSSPEVITRILFLGESGLLIVTLVLLNRICRKIFNRDRYAGFLSLSLYLFLTGLDSYGQEAHLYGFLCVLLLSILQSKSEYHYKEVVSIACLVCLLFLTRIDSLIFFFPVFIFISNFKTRSKIEFRQHVTVYILVFAVILLYFGINIWVFGHIKTISAHLKTNWDIGSNINSYKLWFFCYNEKVLASWLMALLGLVFYFRRLPGYIIILCAGVITYYLLLVLFNTIAIGSWYLVVPYTLTSILFVMLTKDVYTYFSRRIGILKKVNPCLILAVFVIAFMIVHFIIPLRLIPMRGRSDGYRIAIDLRRFDKRSTLYSVNGCGIMSFFSERRIINGDGLVNNFEYQNYLNGKKLEEYFNQQRVEYYIEYFFENKQRYDGAFHNLMVSSNYAPDMATFTTGGNSLEFKPNQLVYNRNNALIFKLDHGILH